MSKHHITNAEDLFFGKVFFPPAGSHRGVPLQSLVFVDLGKPAAADPDGLINDATGAELPDDETITYTFPAENASPTDEALRTGVFDVPRNVVAVATHGSSIVAMTIVITGLDAYGETVVEELAITATGTSKTANGKKAFKSISSIAITSAGDATANTLNIGTGDVLGLPFRADVNRLIAARGANAADTGTFVPADTTEPSATTGDVRGTFDPSTSLNGSNQIGVVLALNSPRNRTLIYGLPQYAG